MAGSRQHFLPRFLIKGFSSRIHKNEYYCWVFTKDNNPYEANLQNIGLEKYFYGKSEEMEVDEIITQQEVKYSAQLERVRSINSACTLDSRFPAEFIAHLIFRAKHLRITAQKAGETAISVMQAELNSPEKYYQLFKNIAKNHPEMIEQSLSRELDKRLPPGFPQDQKDILFKKALAFIPQILSNSAFDDIYSFFNNLFAKMAKEMPNIAEGVHIKGLSKGDVPPKFIEKFEGFDWFLTVAPKHTFILGDIGPIAIYEPSLDFKPFLFAKGKLSQVFLPISDSHMIVGKSYTRQQTPANDTINKASASLSQFFFISCKNRETEQKLSRLISSKSLNISDNEIFDAKQKIRNEWFGEDN